MDNSKLSKDELISVTVSDPENGQVKILEDSQDRVIFYGSSEKEGSCPDYTIYRKDVYSVDQDQGKSSSYYGVFPVTPRGKIQVYGRKPSGLQVTLTDFPHRFEFFDKRR